MLQIDRWKRILIVGLCVIGIGFAVPNLFYQRVESHNDAVAEIDRIGRYLVCIAKEESLA